LGRYSFLQRQQRHHQLRHDQLCNQRRLCQYHDQCHAQQLHHPKLQRAGRVFTAEGGITVQNCLIQTPAGGSHGIYLDGKYSSPTITGNTIKDAPIGIERLKGPGAANIAGNIIKNCTTGIRTYLSSPEIYNNYIESNSYGIRLASGSKPNIHDNDLYSNSIGIYLEQSQPTNVKWNNFGYSGGNILVHADEGILVNYLQSSNTFLDNKWNNFYDGDVTKDISNTTAVTLKARGNYWYALSVTGPVDVSSPQASHNNNAGPGGAIGKLAQSGSEESQQATTLPTAFGLDQNFPNPFNPGTAIGFKLPEASIVTLTIYDVLGRRVRTLISNVSHESGFYKLTWDGNDDFGKALASGIYVYRIEARANHLPNTYSESRKLVLTR
jgi:parallel beta-helix repeat protein